MRTNDENVFTARAMRCRAMQCCGRALVACSPFAFASVSVLVATGARRGNAVGANIAHAEGTSRPRTAGSVPDTRSGVSRLITCGAGWRDTVGAYIAGGEITSQPLLVGRVPCAHASVAFLIATGAVRCGAVRAHATRYNIAGGPAACFVAAGRLLLSCRVQCKSRVLVGWSMWFCVHASEGRSVLTIHWHVSDRLTDTPHTCLLDGLQQGVSG